jgi:polysaccharide export outer membrane protein
MISMTSPTSRRLRYSSLPQFLPLLAGLIWAGPLAGVAFAQQQSSAYHAGPGDTLMISVAGQEAFSGKFRIGPDGSIGYPMLGDVPVAKLTPTEIADRIGRGLSQYVQNGNAVRVSIDEYAPVFVVGDVDRPGQYQYRPGMIALELVAVGGGTRRAEFTTESGKLQLIDTEQQYTDLKLQQFSLRVRHVRIAAEMSGSEFSFPLSDHDSVLDAGVMQHVIDAEAMLFRTRQEVLRNQEKALQDQRASYDPEIAALEQSIKLHDAELALMAEDVAATKTLADQKLTVQSRLREVQRDYSATQRDGLERQSFLARAHQNQLDVDQRIVELHSKMADDNATQLREVDLDIARNDQKLASLLASLSELKRQADSTASAITTMTTAYAITRLVDGQYQDIPAEEQTVVQPGDIVHVEQKLTTSGMRLTLN